MRGRCCIVAQGVTNHLSNLFGTSSSRLSLKLGTPQVVLSLHEVDASPTAGSALLSQSQLYLGAGTQGITSSNMAKRHVSCLQGCSFASRTRVQTNHSKSAKNAGLAPRLHTNVILKAQWLQGTR
ncbi:hypothetical protein ASPCAL10731 [Aspergillus calidoustus]|uniref:Uncharacterized protein n=1 Tax=Aspergillus calidoustus TaxID=454130 RepID=A0A0U5G789_ASPCI|nr:hypothetical protein ASPCAL10731 [Aspergillus calidoustus]